MATTTSTTQMNTIKVLDCSDASYDWTSGWREVLDQIIPQHDENDFAPPKDIKEDELVTLLGETYSDLYHPGEGHCVFFYKPENPMTEDYKTQLRHWVGKLLFELDEAKREDEKEIQEYINTEYPLSGDIFPEEEHRDTRWKAKRGRKPKLERRRITHTERSHNSGKSRRPLTIV